jgi:hypothetical protein
MKSSPDPTLFELVSVLVSVLTLDSQQVFPQEHEVILQHMCLDKGYDYRDVLETIVEPLATNRRRRRCAGL